jgi:hypothetical protein
VSEVSVLRKGPGYRLAWVASWWPTALATDARDGHQRALLRILGCDQGQGFLLGRPVHPDRFQRHLPLALPPGPSTPLPI